ncbi:MAG: hypothetical protein M3R15_25100, partial [Acidobacteriota bacterium]|nr:hypothetical protein [Acidobacteriota bacterium]
NAMSANTEVYGMPMYEAATDEQTDQAAPPPHHAAPALVPLYRDPSDVRTILSMAVAGIVLVLIVLILAGVLIYKVTSSPPLVVVDRTKEGDRVVFMNNQEVVTGGVSLTTDRPGDGAKRSAANIFAAYLYKIDPMTRPDDLEHAIKMMVPASAVELMKQMRFDLERQRAERWQSVWEPQVTSIDPTDPYTVRVLGKQHITRVVKHEVKHETRQLAFNLKLVFDSQGRADRNERTGFLVADLRDFHIITAQQPGQGEGDTGAPTSPSTPATPRQPPGQIGQP